MWRKIFFISYCVGEVWDGQGWTKGLQGQWRATSLFRTSCFESLTRKFFHTEWLRWPLDIQVTRMFCCFSFPTVSLLLHYYICAHIHVFHKVFDVTIFLNLFPFLFWSQVYKIILWFSFILGWNFLSSFVFFCNERKKI